MSLSTHFQNLNKKILDVSEQSVLVQLGQLALSNVPLSDLMQHAAAFISQSLDADYVLVCQLDRRGTYIIQQAGIRRKNGSTNLISNPLEPNSLERFTLQAGQPILVENLQTETRFNTSKLLREHGVLSGLSLPIGMANQGLGVIEVFTQRAHLFSDEQCFFVRNIAHLLAMAIERTRLDAERHELRQQLAKARSMPQSNPSEWDSVEIKNRLRESREMERLRLAQELHDVPIQDLYGLLYQIDDLQDYINDSEGEQILNEHKQMLQRIVNNLRTVCRDLRPPSLSPFGLEVAIRDHVEKLRDQNPDLSIHLELMSDRQILSDSLRLNLYRIYQQAISNVLRHAEASEVHVRFRWDQNTILLEVEDNGRGFEVPNSWVELVRRDHFGLVGLVERLESIHGKLEVVSAVGHGTLVRAVVPRR